MKKDRTCNSIDDKNPTFTPPLKWAGGKRWLVPTLRTILAPLASRRLVEPFVGGMAVTLGLNPKSALLNDNNQHLIHFFLWLQKGLQINIEMRNERQAFDKARARFNELTRTGKSTSRTAAELFYYLNRTCFNGLCRFNSKGGYNVPFGRYSKINYVEDFRHYKPLLKNWEFCCGDFEELRLRPSDVIYADPPYDVEFTKYSKNDFRWDDQERLVEWLSRAKGPVIASNQATDRILRLYRKNGFRIRKLSAPRRIACNGNRDRVEEMLALKGF